MNEEEVLKRGYAQTMEEWWFLVDHHWENLLSIVQRFFPNGAQKAEEAKEERNGHILLSCMNEAWWKAPDEPSIHSIPDWGQLCNLCSDFPYGEDND